jgi:hypothetical protein
MSYSRYATRQKPVDPWPVGKYRLGEKSEMPRRPGGERELLEAETEVWYDGMPGIHMEPLDAQAQANIDHVMNFHGGFKPLDPTSNLSIITGEVDDNNARIAELEAQIQTLRAGSVGARAAGMPQQVPPAPLVGEKAIVPEHQAQAMRELVAGQGGYRDAVEIPAYMRPGGTIPKPPPLNR